MNLPRTSLFLLASLALASACDDSSDGTPGKGRDPVPPATPGACVGDWRAGDYPPGALSQETYLTITGVAGQRDLARQYKVHLPPGYDCKVPAPVVFCLHGLMQTAVSFCVNGTGFPGGTGFPAKSDQEGFILVMPNGHMNSWNGGGCCGTAQSMGLDDVALMKAILREVSAHANVDPRRVFATGFSNGGYLSYRLACEAADVFTAVAPAAGGIAGFECRPGRPVSVLDIHGTSDRFVPYSLQAPSQTTIAAANGCATATAPASVPATGGDTTCVTRSGCPAGVEVTSCTIQGGGHAWFGDPGCGTGVGALGCGVVGANSDFMVNTSAAWEFFRRLSR
jgi:polyhydroxybutyrate depolymerase